ncbi:hypothetical protein RIVERRIDER_47 [Xanthomonas phage RiverRider]|uniref:Uncharacterized protein n=1 Tax=Xanthomonas phage RiverRider TaxID=2108116 RepID=A0A2P1JUV6_9CAUD|nr:hypothetical protein HWB58_gp88 [Xanthomonas phage RiverRider]AVO23128.1 hypothetical protein RIVERRIDER_47 [Xanthomonas phage RiverRider]
MARPKRSAWSSDMTKAPHNKYIVVEGKNDINKSSSDFVAIWSDVYNTFISKTGWVIVGVTRWAEIL